MSRDRTLLDWLLLPYDLFLKYGGIVFSLLLGVGIPLAVFTTLWIMFFNFLQLAVDFPVITIGLFEVLGLPTMMYGVPLLYGLVPGLLMTLFGARNWVSSND